MGIAFSFIFGGIHGMDYFRKSVFTLWTPFMGEFYSQLSDHDERFMTSES